VNNLTVLGFASTGGVPHTVAMRRWQLPRHIRYDVATAPTPDVRRATNPNSETNGRTDPGEERRTVTRIDVARRIPADPTSVALLLASPTAAELFPGARSSHLRPDGVAVVVADLPGRGRTTVEVRTGPLRRMPTSYVVDFALEGDLAPTHGWLTIGYAPSGSAAKVTRASVVIVAAEHCPEDLLRVLAVFFLSGLAALAEARSAA